MVYTESSSKGRSESEAKDETNLGLGNVLDMRMYCRRMETQMMKAVAELPPTSFQEMGSSNNQWAAGYGPDNGDMAVQNSPYSRLYQLDAISKPMQRRTKRMVPCELKDKRYWEKRKRNNDAARRSRENKRQVELDIRSRVMALEDENSLMRKENAMLKSKLGLSPDLRYLSQDDAGELLAVGPMPPPPTPFDFTRYGTSSETDSSCGQYQPETTTPNSNSTQASSATDSSSMCDDTQDECMPMKKRRRPKHEASLVESNAMTIGSSSNNSSPTSSVNIYPHFPAAQPAFAPSLASEGQGCLNSSSIQHEDSNQRSSNPMDEADRREGLPMLKHNYHSSLPAMSAFSQATPRKDSFLPAAYYNADDKSIPNSFTHTFSSHNGHGVTSSMDSEKGPANSPNEVSHQSLVAHTSIPPYPFLSSSNTPSTTSVSPSSASSNMSSSESATGNSSNAFFPGNSPTAGLRGDGNGNNISSPTGNLSIKCDSETRSENDIFRSHLLQLTEEVARMRNYVLQGNTPNK